jgi:hypothetical protein
MDLSYVSIGVAALVIFGAIYLYKKENKQNVEANTWAIFAGLALLFTGAAWFGLLGSIGVQTAAPYTPGYTAPGYTVGIPADAGITTVITDDEQKVISSLSIMTIDVQEATSETRVRIRCSTSQKAKTRGFRPHTALTLQR